MRVENTRQQDSPLAAVTDEYLQRFPEYAAALGDQFQIYQGLDSGICSGITGAEEELSAAPPIVPGLLANRFDIREKLGEGGFRFRVQGVG